MSKTKLVYANYDEKEGMSLVAKDSPYGRVFGHAFVNEEEDSEYANKWDGCVIAEMRADLEIQKRRTKKLNMRADAINEALCYVLNNIPIEELDENNPALHYLEELSFSASKQAKDNQKKLARMKDALPSKIDALLKERQYVRQLIAGLY